jgi:hypothetical protein
LFFPCYPFLLSSAFPFLPVCFLSSLCCGLLLAISMAEASHFFWICSRNLVRRFVLFTGLYPL